MLRLCLVAFTLMACGPSQCCRSSEEVHYEAAHQETLAHATDAYEYTRPLGEAWPEILAVCAEHGYRFDAPTPVEGRTLESQDKATPEGTGSHRLLLRVIRVDAARWKLTLQEQSRYVQGDASAPTVGIDKDWPGSETHRIAWTLLQRLDPSKSSEIEANATQRAERAGAVGQRYDRGCSACAQLVTPN